MLHHEVPWWIGQKYQIAIVDLGGKVIAAKFTVGERPGSLWHEIDFTPPGNGLRLRATAYHLGMGLAFPLLAGLMGLLLLLLGVSLWKIRQHIRRRHKVESMLREEMALRAAMEDSMKNGLIVMDPRGTIVRVNRAFCEMTGRTAEALTARRRLIPSGPPNIWTNCTVLFLPPWPATCHRTVLNCPSCAPTENHSGCGCTPRR
jgi:PAS domain-containing protein